MADFIYNTKHLELEILYEDADFVVVAKPPGLLSVPGTLPELQDSVLTRIRTRYNNPGAEAVHRLDMATSGIILIALSKEAEVELKRQFRDRETQKTYYALVRGKVKFTKQFIELPLSTD